MIDMIIFSLELLQMRVVVVRSHAWMRSVDTLVNPRIRVCGIVRNHIAHGALVRLCRANAVLCLVGGPFGVCTVGPVRTIGIDVLSANDIQLIGLEVIGGMYLKVSISLYERHRA